MQNIISETQQQQAPVQFKGGIIGALVCGLLFFALTIWLIYRAYNDDSACKSKIPLMIIAILWFITSLCQIGFSAYALTKLN